MYTWRHPTDHPYWCCGIGDPAVIVQQTGIALGLKANLSISYSNVVNA
jgi:hypothetical protein